MDCKDMLDRLGSVVVTTDPEGNILYLNDVAGRAFAKYGDRESMIGRNLSECHKPETMTKIRDMYDAFKSGDKQPRFYLRDDEKGKRTVVQTPIYNGDELEAVMEIIFPGIP